MVWNLDLACGLGDSDQSRRAKHLSWRWLENCLSQRFPGHSSGAAPARAPTEHKGKALSELTDHCRRTRS